MSASLKDRPPDRKIWVISEGRYIDVDLTRLVQGRVTGPIKEYRVSDLARYLLSPEPIEVEKRLLGCEIHFVPTASEKFRNRIRSLLPGRLKTWVSGKKADSVVILSRHQGASPRLQDALLDAHVKQIQASLRPYDPAFKRLAELDPAGIADIVGICRDMGGNRSYLNIPGAPAEQIDYMVDSIGNHVQVVLEKAYMAEGLFELKGFDFTVYDAKNTHRLLKFFQDGTTRACLLNADHSICWVDDIKLVHYMQLFEQSIRNNVKLRDSLAKCIHGEARPMKLLFNKQLEIDYSQSNFPRIFNELFEAHHMGRDQKQALATHLNHLQIGVAFNYVPRGGSGEDKLYTDISVMQDVRALDPIREALPLLYSEMNKRATASEEGRFYLLDAIRGIQK
jgi:hypothetical protein